MNKVIITGATSMIGVALINECINRNIECVAIFRPGSKRMSRLPKSKLVVPMECELAEMETLENIALMDADAFFHLGWCGTNKIERNNPRIQQQNIEYTLVAVELAYRHHCKRFIGAGSQAEYGRVAGSIASDRSVQPEIAYGVAKYAAGRLSKMSCEALGMEHIWTRIFSIYGPWDNDSTLISSVLSHINSMETVSTTKAEQLWDFLYVKDAANALVQIALYGHSGETYNIGSGVAIPLKKFLTTIEQKFKCAGLIKYGEIAYAKNQVMHLQADITNLVKDTGFQPKYSFEEGICETMEWMRETK